MKKYYCIVTFGTTKEIDEIDDIISHFAVGNQNMIESSNYQICTVESEFSLWEVEQFFVGSNIPYMITKLGGDFTANLVDDTLNNTLFLDYQKKLFRSYKIEFDEFTEVPSFKKERKGSNKKKKPLKKYEKAQEVVLDVDVILDKIHKNGIKSLSKEEKNFLDNLYK